MLAWHTCILGADKFILVKFNFSSLLTRQDVSLRGDPRNWRTSEKWEREASDGQMEGGGWVEGGWVVEGQVVKGRREDGGRAEEGGWSWRSLLSSTILLKLWPTGAQASGKQSPQGSHRKARAPQTPPV